MSRVFLVRHAQASFLEPNYDQLSPAGERQAHLLGQYWAKQGVVLDRVWTGPRVRQLGTAKIVGRAFRDACLAFPELIVMEEFDECDAERVLRQSLPGLLETSQQVRHLHEIFCAAVSHGERSKAFQRVFEAVITRWVSGELAVADVESWAEFDARVNRGVSRFMARCGHGATAAIFTSGGPIAVAVARALNLGPLDTLRVMWMSRNCSYSEFLFSGERFTMSSFNATPHLDEAALITYR